MIVIYSSSNPFTILLQDTYARTWEPIHRYFERNYPWKASPPCTPISSKVSNHAFLIGFVKGHPSLNTHGNGTSQSEIEHTSSNGAFSSQLCWFTGGDGYLSSHVDWLMKRPYLLGVANSAAIPRCTPIWGPSLDHLLARKAMFYFVLALEFFRNDQTLVV